MSMQKPFLDKELTVHTQIILEPEQFPATSNFVQWWKTKSLTRSFKLYSLCLQQAALGRDYYENR